MSEQKQTELKNQAPQKQYRINNIQQQKDELKQKRERSREKQPKQKDDSDIKKQKQQNKSQKSDNQQQNEDSYPEQQEMMNVLGFSSFKTSKNKDHSKSAVEGVFKNSSVARKYRQYMNRPGNFNRKLDAI